MKFQVVCEDTKGYIEQFKDFQYKGHDQKEMLEYIQRMATWNRVNRIVITRWNDKGERE